VPQFPHRTAISNRSSSHGIQPDADFKEAEFERREAIEHAAENRRRYRGESFEGKPRQTSRLNRAKRSTPSSGPLSRS